MPFDPKVNIGVCLILYDPWGQRVLLGHRIGKLGNDTWCFPGGWHDFGEQPRDTAVRELKEETGVELDSSKVNLLGVFSHLLPELDIWCATIYFVAEVDSKTFRPKVMEPEKLDEWSWRTPAQVPENLFESTGKALEELFRRLHAFSSALDLTGQPWPE